jgi:hypothetical protein
MSMKLSLQKLSESAELSPVKKLALNQMIDRVCTVLGEGTCLDDAGPFLVKVPGDRTPWVVFGSWSDGTLDIIRRDSTQSNILWGWSPGQSSREYHKELSDEVEEDAESETKVPTRRPYPIWDSPKKRR